MSDEKRMCPTCHCCELEAEDCGACGGDGYCGHDCGEDTCCCDDPEDNMRCDYCNGRGWHWTCLGGCEGGESHRQLKAVQS